MWLSAATTIHISHIAWILAFIPECSSDVSDNQALPAGSLTTSHHFFQLSSNPEAPTVGGMLDVRGPAFSYAADAGAPCLHPASHSRCLREGEVLYPPLPVSGVWAFHVAKATFLKNPEANES